ncbi:MAG: hypothetical protein WDO73_15030 [Ignavibacteriota bacterium]
MASSDNSSRQNVVRDRIIVTVAAWIEILVGISFLVAIGGQSNALFGVAPEGVAVLFGRLAGVALIGLGLVCLPSKVTGAEPGAGRGLFIFNLVAAIFFVWVAVGTAFHGFMLWPVVMLHAVLTIALAPQVLRR